MRKLSSWNRGTVREKNRASKSAGTHMAQALLLRLDREEKGIVVRKHTKKGKI